MTSAETFKITWPSACWASNRSTWLDHQLEMIYSDLADVEDPAATVPIHRFKAACRCR